MIKDNLIRMIKGWFIGDFSPTLLNTQDFEIAVKRYKAGDYDPTHVHKIATEYTCIISGEAEMNNIRYKTDDIIVIEPGEYTDFRAITDAVNVVIKVPCVKGDKYPL
jgi:mannose-6-phosphate isomerase-like protein (cupin superfamily)